MPEKMLTVAGDTRVACVIFGVQSDSDVVGVVGVFCCKLYATSYFKLNANKINLNIIFWEIFEFFCNRDVAIYLLKSLASILIVVNDSLDNSNL